MRTFAVCSQNISTLAVAIPEHFSVDAMEEEYCNRHGRYAQFSGSQKVREKRLASKCTTFSLAFMIATVNAKLYLN